MRKIINHLRNQPEEVRHHVVHLSVAVAGVVLVVLWLFSLGGTVGDPQNIQAELSNDLKPFSALTQNLADGYQSFSATAIEGE